MLSRRKVGNRAFNLLTFILLIKFWLEIIITKEVGQREIISWGNVWGIKSVVLEAADMRHMWFT